MSRNEQPELPTSAAAAQGVPTVPAMQLGIDRGAEEAHWRARHESTSWYRPGRSYEDYQPAYELGWSRRAQSDAHFDAQENELAAEWESRRGKSPLDWPEARAASRAAWDRVGVVHYEQARQVGMTESFAFIEPPNDAPDEADSAYRATTPDAPVRAASADVAPRAANTVLSDSEVVDVLNHLLENARDGEHGYHTFAQEVSEPELKQVFDERANQCRQASLELLPLIAQYGGTPAEGGTVLGALHRGWVQLKGALGGDGAESMLNECERAEDLAIDRYRSALQHRLPADVRAVLERQSVQTRQQHEWIRELRDAMQAREQ